MVTHGHLKCLQTFGRAEYGVFLPLKRIHISTTPGIPVYMKCSATFTADVLNHFLFRNQIYLRIDGKSRHIAERRNTLLPKTKEKSSIFYPLLSPCLSYRSLFVPNINVFISFFIFFAQLLSLYSIGRVSISERQQQCMMQRR